MANALTIQLRPTQKYSAPSVANLIHNAGLAKATYWIKDSNNIIQKFTIKNVAHAIDLWRSWEDYAKLLINIKKNRNPLKNQILIEEGLLVIGKDVLEKDPKIFIQIFKEFEKWFEEKYNTKILYWSFHNHEGHFTEEGEFSQNLHIHFFFRNVDNFGESVRRKIKKADLSYFQDKIFEIGKKYIPTLQRAKNYFKEGKKAPKHKSHRQYRTEKEREKEQKLLAKIKDLKELNKQIREEFKKLGAKREDYAKLEQLVKDLIIKIKNKELSLQEMQEEFNKQLDKLKKLAYSKKYTYSDTKKPVPNEKVVEYLEERLNKKDKQIEELKNKLLQTENRVQELKEENKKLKEEIELLKQQLMQNYKAEITCITCKKVKPFNPIVLMQLKSKKLIENYEIDDESRVTIKTQEFELEEKENKTGFRIKKEGQLTEEEIEKALLIILQIKGLDINNIQANGSEDFVEKANKVIEKLKVEKIVEENFENLRWSLSEQFYRYCEKNNPEYNDFNEFFKNWIVEHVLKGNINLNDYINAKSANLGFKFKR